MSNLVTPPIVLEWSSLFKAATSKMNPAEAPKFGCRCLLTAKAIESQAWQNIAAEIAKLVKSEFPGEARIRYPLRDDVAGRGWPSQFVGFFNAKSGQDFRPGVVDRDGQPIIDTDDIYPGCVVRLSLRLFGWSGKFGTGISLGLQDLQKLADGEPLRGARGGGATASMGALPDDDELEALVRGAA
jgi:hypothetical protein